MVNERIAMGLYEKALPPYLSWRDKLSYTHELGYDYLEMSIDESDEKIQRLTFDEENCQELRKTMKETQVSIDSICLSALRRYALGSENENLRKLGVKIAMDTIDLAKRLGIRMIQLPGYDVYYEESNQESETRFLHNLRILCDYAATKGVIMGFETMETAFMDTATKAMRYISMLHSPYLQLYPDVGNLSNAMHVYGMKIEHDLKCADGHILAMHLKETRSGYYRNLNYGEGTCDFEKMIHLALSQHVHRFVCELWYQGECDWKSILQRNSAYMFSLVSTCVQKERW